MVTSINCDLDGYLSHWHSYHIFIYLYMERTCVVMDYPIKYLGRLKAGVYLRYIYEFPVNCVYVADSPIRVWIVRSSILRM